MNRQSDQRYEELLAKLRSNSTEERQVAADQLSIDPDVDVLLRSMAYVLDSADELIDRGSSALRQDAPGVVFRIGNDRFFEVFACDERSIRKTSDIEKTL